MWRVVLDNAALTSALLNPHGSAARLLDYAHDGRLRLFTTNRMLALEDKVLRHPALTQWHGLDTKGIKEVIKDLPVLLCLVESSAGKKRPHEGMAAELAQCASWSHADFVVTAIRLPAHEVQQGGTQIIKADQLVKLVGHES
ncbi:MAG: hypothetical protein ACOC9B_06555 [Chloroflexota bacterium]